MPALRGFYNADALAALLTLEHCSCIMSPADSCLLTTVTPTRWLKTGREWSESEFRLYEGVTSWPEVLYTSDLLMQRHEACILHEPLAAARSLADAHFCHIALWPLLGQSDSETEKQIQRGLVGT